MPERMMAAPLPYDMGNSGDMLKHGMIAEFAQWWCSFNREPFIFYDPFGGLPWVSPPNQKVTERLLQLQDCALLNAQPKPHDFYYGSGHVVKNVIQKGGGTAKVFISDRDENAVKDLLDSRLELIERQGFVGDNAYSILNCGLTINDANLLLIDPFADFFENPADLLSETIDFVSTANVPLILFLLHNKEMSGAYEIFQDQRSKKQGKDIVQFSYSCPQLQSTGIRGEDKYISDSILFLPSSFNTDRLSELSKALKKYSEMLAEILCVNINFE